MESIGPLRATAFGNSARHQSGRRSAIKLNALSPLTTRHRQSTYKPGAAELLLYSQATELTLPVTGDASVAVLL
jgi:hypothetical protein